MTQMSLFGVPVDVGADAAPPRRRPARQRMPEIQCPSCGELFRSFSRGVRCDDCRKQRRAETPKVEGRSLQMTAADTWEDFCPGY